MKKDTNGYQTLIPTSNMLFFGDDIAIEYALDDLSAQLHPPLPGPSFEILGLNTLIEPAKYIFPFCWCIDWLIWSILNKDYV